MKTCSLFNVPVEVAKDAIESMKALIIQRIKKEELENLEDLIYTLQGMMAEYKGGEV